MLKQHAKYRQAFTLFIAILSLALWVQPASAVEASKLRLLRGEFSSIEQQAKDDSKLAVLTFSDQFGPAAFHIAKYLSNFMDINHPVPQFLMNYAGNSPHPDMPVAIAQSYFEGMEGIAVNPQKSLYWSFRALQLEQTTNLPVLYQMMAKIALEAPDAPTQTLNYSSKCIETKPDSGQCHTYRAQAYIRSGKTAEAMKDYYKAQSLGDAEASLFLARKALQMGNLEEAEIMGRSAAFRGYTEGFAVVSKLYSIRYERQKSLKDAQMAVVWAQQGIKEGCTECYIPLATLMLNAGYETEAETVFEQGAKAKDPKLLQSAAEFYIKKHNVEEALVYIQLLNTCEKRSGDMPKSLTEYWSKHWQKINAYRKSQINQKIAELNTDVSKPVNAST
jgi:tetratricopeptide (TPR) repeat protein